VHHLRTHPWSPRNFAYLFITIQQLIKSVRKMTLFWHYPSFIAGLLVHQLYIQSTFHVHQSDCMKNTTKKPLHTVNPTYHPSYNCPSCKILAKVFPKSTGDFVKPRSRTHDFQIKIILSKFSILNCVFFYEMIQIHLTTVRYCNTYCWIQKSVSHWCSVIHLVET